MKGPIHRHIEPTKVFPNLEGVAQFQDGFPLFLTTMESLADLQGLVAHSAKGEDPKWRIGKMDSEAWRDGGRLRMERCVFLWLFVCGLGVGQCGGWAARRMRECV